MTDFTTPFGGHSTLPPLVVVSALDRLIRGC